jgi:hypothetical protein
LLPSVGADPTGGAIFLESVEEPRPLREWRVLDRLEKTAIGKRGADWVATVRRREPAGCLLYGPYWQLPSGDYRLIFSCRSGKPRMPRQPVLGVEVIAMNRVQLAWLDFTAAELRAETGLLDFSVPPELGLGAGDEARLEFRFSHLGNADLAITRVDLLEREAEAVRPSLPMRWRMLGRLEKAAIAKRTPEGIKARRAKRAGCVLHGGRPLLQLPVGNYRLGFKCDAGTPLLSSQPVVGVEVIAWRRWQDDRPWSWASLLGLPARGGLQQAWRDFTAAELSSGSTSIDFAVPAELSLEGGQEVLFGFRFIQLGNADLAITAVDLKRAADDEATPRRPREWRLLGRLARSSIRGRGGDNVSARQAEPAGLLLHGGRPKLQLQPGRYRLGFRCHAGTPLNASQPVLGIEIAVRNRLLTLRKLLRPIVLLRQRQDFTSEELCDGAGWIQFDVPEVPGETAGEDLVCEFRFFHLGNADLTIGAVCLHEAAEPKDAPRGVGTSSPRSPATSTDKTNVIIIGNCQAQTVYEALMRTRAFNTRVDAKYHFVGLQQNLHELARNELANCEILLVQDINDWENYPLRSDIRTDLPIIKFPLLHFASLWPFDHYNGPGDREAYEREAPNLTFLYLDGLLARLRREIPDREQRLSAYRSLSIEGVVNYVRLHDFEKRRLIAMDQQFGFNIGQFILENFQTKRLFYTTNHPNGQILDMLLQHLLKYLGVEERYRPIASLDHLKRLQVPVHPKVATALGVKWVSENTKYLYGGERLTWETYVRRYIEHYG